MCVNYQMSFIAFSVALLLLLHGSLLIILFTTTLAFHCISLKHGTTTSDVRFGVHDKHANCRFLRSQQQWHDGANDDVSKVTSFSEHVTSFDLWCI